MHGGSEPDRNHTAWVDNSDGSRETRVRKPAESDRLRSGLRAFRPSAHISAPSVIGITSARDLLPRSSRTAIHAAHSLRRLGQCTQCAGKSATMQIPGWLDWRHPSESGPGCANKPKRRTLVVSPLGDAARPSPQSLEQGSQAANVRGRMMFGYPSESDHKPNLAEVERSEPIPSGMARSMARRRA